jgi:hypothetical protein
MITLVPPAFPEASRTSSITNDPDRPFWPLNIVNLSVVNLRPKEFFFSIEVSFMAAAFV